MRRRLLPLGLLGLVAAWLAVASSSAAPATSWGGAIKVPGIAALGTEAVAYSLSCPAPGNCAAGGIYRDRSRHLQAYVVDETNGVWGTAIEVPGTAALNIGGLASVNSISCGSPGNCVAGGFYSDASSAQAFVVDETDGTWGTAIEVPGTAALNTGGYSHDGPVGVSAVSCASVGNCAAVGNAIEQAGAPPSATFAARSFVAEEVDGTWNTAIELPGTANVTPDVRSVSCPTAGNCTAGGAYEDATGWHAFVVDEKNGTWGDAAELPGTATPGDSNSVESISCTGPGNCAAGGQYGYYDPGTLSHFQAFVADETNGVWSSAITVPGTRALNIGGRAAVESVSCASPGNCAAGGFYADGNGWDSQGFVASEKHGRWRHAISLQTYGQGSDVRTVSCATAGDCAAGGFVSRPGHRSAVVIGETNGRWSTAVPVRGIPHRYSRSAGVGEVSCPAPGDCVATGSYGRVDHVHPFLLDTRAARASVSVSPGSGRVQTVVTVSGTGFAPGELVVVRYVKRPGSRRTICETRPDAAGAFTCRGWTPVSAELGRYGAHRIVATGSTGDRASTTFTHSSRRS